MRLVDLHSVRIDLGKTDALVAGLRQCNREASYAGEGVEVAYAFSLAPPAIGLYCFRHTLWHHALMPKPTTIRLSDEDKEAALRKGEEWGLRDLSAIIRFALKRLRSPK